VPGGAALFGYGELGLAGLQTLTSVGALVSAVVVPGNRAGREVDMMCEAAARQAVPLLVQPPRHAVAGLVDALGGMQLNLIVVWSYSMILPPSVLALPAMGAVNIHGGLLPQYRGGHVTQWAIINGEREFGVTLHYVDEGIDTGPVIAERRFPLEDTDDAFSVREKQRAAGAQLLEEWWPRLAGGVAPSVPQDESRARLWPLRTPEQGRIAWTMSALAVSRLVRALAANSPGAYVELNGRRFSVRRATSWPSLERRAAPGDVVAVDAAGVRVATLEGDVLISSAEDAEGRPVAPGDLAELLAHAGN